MKTIVQTSQPFCLDEPDFTLHGEVSEKDPSEIRLKPLKMNCSAGEDNHTDSNLIEDSLSRFTKEKINCLDLGCAAGQLILDYSKRSETNVCIGLDGSCGVYKQQNWLIAENKEVLRHANLVENFSILDETNNKIKFDIITCWEVIEHFREEDLHTFFQNVANHLSDDGVFFGSIALFPDVRDVNGYHQDCPDYDPNSEQFLLHKTVFESRDPWDEILEKYFKVEEYDFNVKLRNHNDSYYFKVKPK